MITTTALLIVLRERMLGYIIMWSIDHRCAKDKILRGGSNFTVTFSCQLSTNYIRIEVLHKIC